MGCIESAVDLIQEKLMKNKSEKSKSTPSSRASERKHSLSSPWSSTILGKIRSGNFTGPNILLMKTPFSVLTQYTQHLFFTGLAGLSQDVLRAHNIKCLINLARDEIPTELVSRMVSSSLVHDRNGGGTWPMATSSTSSTCLSSSSLSSLTYYEFHIPESLHASVEKYFDHISNLINRFIQGKHGNVVVFCVAGMSRSSTIVMAYVIRQLKKTLKESFNQLQKVRPYARPNLNYFQQLVHYEHKCLESNSIKIIPCTIPGSQGVADGFGNSTAEGVATKDTLRLKKASTASSVGANRSLSSAPYVKQSASGKKVDKIMMPDVYLTDFVNLSKLELNIYLFIKKEKKPFAAQRSGTNSSSQNCSKSMKPIKPYRSSHSRRKSKSKSRSQRSRTSRFNDRGNYQQEYTGELRPFILETVHYKTFVKEFSKHIEKQLPMNNSSSLVVANMRSHSASSVASLNSRCDHK